MIATGIALLLGFADVRQQLSTKFVVKGKLFVSQQSGPRIDGKYPHLIYVDNEGKATTIYHQSEFYPSTIPTALKIVTARDSMVEGRRQTVDVTAPIVLACTKVL